MAIACDPDSNPKAFDAACNEARVRPVSEGAYKEVDKARSDYQLALENACHNWPPLSLDTVWGEWDVKRAAEKPDADPKDIQSYITIQLHKAFMRFHRTGNSRPLLEALRALHTPEALASLDPVSVARLGELLNARGQPLKVGRPRGQPNRWRSARHVAVFIVERIKVQWRSEYREDEVPADVVEKFVHDVIQFMKTWDTTKRRRWLRYKPLTANRVFMLLHESKRRRRISQPQQARGI
jgi:hypothetical protein